MRMINEREYSSVLLLNRALFHDRGLYTIETSPLICSANQLIGFYLISTSVMKELTYDLRILRYVKINTFMHNVEK